MSPRQIRGLRRDLGLSQAQLAQLLGVHQLTVWKWEKGRTSPTPHQAEMMRSFARAQEREPRIGATVAGLLVGAGAIVAIYALLRAAIGNGPDERR